MNHKTVNPKQMCWKVYSS